MLQSINIYIKHIFIFLKFVFICLSIYIYVFLDQYLFIIFYYFFKCIYNILYTLLLVIWHDPFSHPDLLIYNFYSLATSPSYLFFCYKFWSYEKIKFFSNVKYIEKKKIWCKNFKLENFTSKNLGLFFIGYVERRV